MNAAAGFVVGAVFIVSASVTTWLIRSRIALEVLDQPNARSLHATPKRRTGGLAILGSVALGILSVMLAARTGWASGVLVGAAIDFGHKDMLAIITTAVLLSLVSLWDDIRELSPGFRLATQILAAAGLIVAGDFTIAGMYVPGIGWVPLGALSYPCTLLFLVWMTNLYNFMDGMDGFAGGMAVIGFGFLGGLALAEGAAGLGVLALIVAAAAGGFLVFNFPPAKIFMGDVGSVPLGFLAAALAIKANRGQTPGLWISVMLFSPFIIDATVVLVRRASRGAKIWQAHREHHYQRLILAGWSHKKTVLAEYALMVGCGVAAIICQISGVKIQLAILVLLAATYGLLANRVRAIEQRQIERART